MSFAEEPSGPCTESEDHLSQMAIRQDRRTEADSRATGSVDVEKCCDLGWPEVHAFCARQCCVQELEVADLGGFCLAFEVPLWDAVVQMLKAPRTCILRSPRKQNCFPHTHPFSKGAEQTVSYQLPWGMLMLSSFVNPVILT